MKKYIQKESKKETLLEIKRFCLDQLPLELPSAESIEFGLCNNFELKTTTIQKSCFNSVIRKIDEMLNYLQ